MIIYFASNDISPYDTAENLVSLTSVSCVSGRVSGEIIIIILFIIPNFSIPLIFMYHIDIYENCGTFN